MMTFAKLSMMVLTFQTLHTLHPVKLSVILLFFSSSMFLMMVEFTGSTWFPSIFFMLFMGGILVMFMVLSSLLPNNKWSKFKISILTSATLLSVILMKPWINLTKQNIEMDTKWVVSSNMTLYFMIVIIMIYFFSFVKILTMNNMSLRSAVCSYTVIL